MGASFDPNSGLGQNMEAGRVQQYRNEMLERHTWNASTQVEAPPVIVRAPEKKTEVQVGLRWRDVVLHAALAALMAGVVWAAVEWWKRL